MTEQDAIERLRQAVQKAGSQAALARRIGVTRGMICGILTGRFAMTDRIARAIGLARVVQYQEVQE